MSEHKLSSKPPVTLTVSDWIEIYYALYGKVKDISEGKYDNEDDPGFPVEWADWLERIMKAIGPTDQRPPPVGLRFSTRPDRRKRSPATDHGEARLAGLVTAH